MNEDHNNYGERSENENTSGGRMQQIRDTFYALIPNRHFFITPILIDLNLLVFLLMALSGVSIFSPDSESLLKWGANYTPMTLEGQWWRLFTCTFLHIGILHLLFNMYALLNIGILLEPLLGRVRFLVAYILTGITASMASLWWHDVTLSAGASGAIFGMYGLFLAMLTTNYIEKTARKELLSSIGLFVGYNLLFGLSQGIDNAAHIGGLLSGLAIGYAFMPGLKKSYDKKLNNITLAAVSVVIIALLIVVYFRIPNNIGEYDKRIAQFSDNESKALAFHQSQETKPKEQVLKELKDASALWEENIQLMKEAAALQVPEEASKKAADLVHYSELRLQFDELSYKAISEGTDKYDPEIENCGKQIGDIISKLNAESKNE
jgi:rhomboid protease GluP